MHGVHVVHVGMLFWLRHQVAWVTNPCIVYPVTWHVLCNSVLLVQALCNEVCLSARYGFGGVIYFYERVRDALIWWVVFQLRSHGKVLLTDKTPVCW
jgi:hypothetical protein